MFQSGIFSGLGLAAGLWLTATASVAAPQTASAMQFGPTALPPAAYVAFCKRQPWDCGAAPQEVLARADQAEADRASLIAAATPASLQAMAEIAPASVVAPTAKIKPPRPIETFVAPLETGQPQMGPQLWSTLNRVNNKVNRAVVQATDLATYGKVDFWSTPIEDQVRTGDCEDYVLEKQRALLADGLPRQALNIALVTTPWGESHAVLLVATSEGEFVLDNLSPMVLPWQATGYTWRERQVGGDPFNWVMVRDPARKRLASATLQAAAVADLH